MADIINTNVEGLYAIRDSLVKFQEQMGSVQKEFIEAFSELESQMLTNARRKIQEIEERQHERDKKRRTDSFSCPQCGVRIILKINSDTAPCREAHCNGVMRRVYLQSDYTREQQNRDKQELAAIREALDSYKKQKEEFVEVASIAIHNGGSIEPGMVFQDDGFMSCSLVSDNPFANYEKCIFRITAPAGTHAAYLGDLSMYPTENELLVGRGHCIYINQVTEAPRNTLTNNPYQTENVLIIDGVLGI